ncbi:MAG: hypothetical protein Q9169_000027 [Polycauliona sp. 2 TL-2023]
MIPSIPTRRGLAILRNASYSNASGFSTSTRNWKARPRRSPTVRDKEWARQQGLPAPPPSAAPVGSGASETSVKWPMGPLEHYINRSNTFVPVTLKHVTAILDDVDALGLKMAKMQAKTICSEYGIEAIVLPSLGAVLLSHNDLKYRDIATTLFICGLDSGDPRAISFAAHYLLNDAILTGRHDGPGVAAARKVVQEEVMTHLPTSIFLEGKLLEHEGKPLQALQLYQTCSDKEIQYRKDAKEGSVPSWRIGWTPEYGDICKALARIRAKLGDRTGAKEAIRDAALVYDDPAAYYYFATEFVEPGSQEFERFLLKAASSDQPKASHELGMFYLNQSRPGIHLREPRDSEPALGKDPSSNTRISNKGPIKLDLSRKAILDKRAEALEWFNIAAESGITASQVYLALLLREAGRAEEGLIWLQAANKSDDADDWMEAVEYFKSTWRLSAPDPMQLDIESLRKSSKKPKRKGVSRLEDFADVVFRTDTFLHMKRVGGQWYLDDRGRREWNKHEQRMAASWL